MNYRAFSILVSILLILCLSSCQDIQNDSVIDTTTSDSATNTTSIESHQPVNTMPIVSESNLIGIWTGGQATDAGHIRYLYFSSNGVYYMSKKSGKPSTSEFTSEYLIDSSYSISVNSTGDTICSFGNWTATFSSKSSMWVSGQTISGAYRK